jgi:hypothetical protein
MLCSCADESFIEGCRRAKGMNGLKIKSRIAQFLCMLCAEHFRYLLIGLEVLINWALRVWLHLCKKKLKGKLYGRNKAIMNAV